MIVFYGSMMMQRDDNAHNGRWVKERGPLSVKKQTFLVGSMGNSMPYSE